MLVVTCGAVSGSLLPLFFKRFGLDPALMSNPFVAAISDILAIVIYMTVALTSAVGDVTRAAWLREATRAMSQY